MEQAVRAAAVVGLQGEELQYVTTNGTLYCPLLAPCVTFKTGKAIVISKRGQLFQVSADSRRLSGAEFSSASPSRDSLLGGLDPVSERVVSLGFNQFAVARLVDPGKKAKR